jgi:type II restriction enzyme
MKKINYYKNKKLLNENEVFNFFIENLQLSILTWDFFVDWKKIKEKMRDIEDELNLLNVLIGKKNSEEKFINLINKYPTIKKVLSLLIAMRESKLNSTYIVDREDIGKNLDYWNTELKKDYFKINKEFDKKSKEEIIKFYKNSGLKDLFENKDIKNVQDYYFGVEVGMDTNARKNRTGIAMELIVKKYIDKNFKNYIWQATKEKIKERWGINFNPSKIKSNKSFDFAVIDKNKKLYLIEVNYYNGGGSKLKSTAGEYRNYQKFLKEQKTEFIWITDGLGWKTQKNDLYDTFINNDYVFNLKMLSEGILKEIIK